MRRSGTQPQWREDRQGTVRVGRHTYLSQGCASQSPGGHGCPGFHRGHSPSAHSPGWGCLPALAPWPGHHWRVPHFPPPSPGLPQPKNAYSSRVSIGWVWGGGGWIAIEWKKGLQCVYSRIDGILTTRVLKQNMVGVEDVFNHRS